MSEAAAMAISHEAKLTSWQDEVPRAVYAGSRISNPLSAFGEPGAVAEIARKGEAASRIIAERLT